MKWMSCGLLAGILCFGSALAAEYHVANEGLARDGIDPASTFQTIQAAVEKAAPGDTVWIHPGTYREAISIPAKPDSAPGQYLTLAAVEPGKAILSGAESLNTNKWEDLGGGWFRTQRPAGIVNSGWLFIDEMPAPFSYDPDAAKPGSFITTSFMMSARAAHVAATAQPDEGEKAAEGVTWKSVQAPNGILDFRAEFGDQARDAVFYAVSYVYAPSDFEPASLRAECDFSGLYQAGSSASEPALPLRVWVNGKLVETWGRPFPRAGRLRFNKGWNTILVQVVCSGAPSQSLSLGVTDNKYGQAGKAKFLNQARKPKEGGIEGSMAPAAMVAPKNPSHPGLIGQWLVAGPFHFPHEEESVYLRLGASETPDRHRLEWATRPTVLSFKQENPNFPLKLKGLSFRHAANRFQVSMVMLSENSIVEDCEVLGSTNRGLTAPPGSQVLRNRVIGHGCLGIGGTPTNGRIAQNFVSGNNWLSYSSGNEAGGMKLVRTHNAVFQGNHVEKNNSWGIWLDWDCFGNRIEQNICLENKFAGIMIEASYGQNIIANNISAFSHGSEYSDGIYLQDTSDSLVVHNLCFNNAGFGIRAALLTDRVVMSADRQTRKKVASSNNRVLNNICFGNQQGQIHLPKEKGARITENQSDYNLLFQEDLNTRAGHTPPASPETITTAMDIVGPDMDGDAPAGPAVRLDLEKLRRAGFEIHSQEGKPAFLNADQRDFRPAPGSPACGMAPAIPEVATDFAGKARKEPMTAAGPFECDGSTATGP